MDRLTAAKVFLSVVETGSFTASSKILNLSRSMVTRYVETTEQWLGARLLHRSTRRVTLTSIGEEYLPYIENLLVQSEALSTMATCQSHVKGNIRIATSVSLGFSLLSRALPSFMATYPDVTIEIVNADERVDLVEQQIDLAVRITASPDESLIGKPIATCSSVLVATQDYLSGGTEIVSPEDLRHHSCIQYANFHDQSWNLYRGDDHRAVKVSSKVSANEATFLLHACLSGLGIAQLPMYLVDDYVRDGKLVTVMDGWHLKDMPVYVLYSSRKHLPNVVRAMIEHLEEYLSRRLTQVV